jgi:phosphate-selective porin OprO/OprP
MRKPNRAPALSALILAGTLALLALPRLSFGQTPAVPAPGDAVPTPPSVPEAPNDPAAAPAVPAAETPRPVPTAVPADLARQVEEAEQTARIAARKVELFEEKQAEKAKEAAFVTADEKGFAIKSADQKTFIQVRGLLQIDTRWFLGDDTVAKNNTTNAALIDNDSILIRRFRPEIGGTLGGLADFLFSPDFSGGAVTIFDAYADLHPFPWLRLHVGKFKTPLGLERLQSEGAYPFLERALDQNLTPGRDIGAALQGDIAGGIVNYSLGVYDGFPDNANNNAASNVGGSVDGDNNHAKDFIGRLFFQPLKTIPNAGALGVGFAASTGNRKGSPTTVATPTFRSAGQQAIFAYAAASTTLSPTFAHLRETHLNPQLYYYYGPVGLLAEYVWVKQGVQRGNTTADLSHKAYHVSASFVLGGKPTYEGVTIDHSYDLAAGHLGALELAGRWDALIIDDGAFDNATPAGGGYATGFANPTTAVSKAQGWTGAVVYHPLRTLKLALNFEQTFFKGGAAGADKIATDRKTENLLFARVHVKF